jgi:carbon-monoxide dehydrogenase small subunit
MTIGFILNGEDVVIESDADVRLIDILRENFGLSGAKKSCLTGKCGICTVIFNGMASPSCLIPAFKIMDSEIITIEGFSQTDEYNDIISGFTQVDVDNCDYCYAGKILCTEAILTHRPRFKAEDTAVKRTTIPSKERILAGFSGINCRCTNSEKLVDGVRLAANIRQRRLYG